MMLAVRANSSAFTKNWSTQLRNNNNNDRHHYGLMAGPSIDPELVTTTRRYSNRHCRGFRVTAFTSLDRWRLFCLRGMLICRWHRWLSAEHTAHTQPWGCLSWHCVQWSLV